MKEHIQGLIAAVFTPLQLDGALNLEQVEPIVEHLVRNKISGLYVCGSTGEGSSLTSEERRRVAEAYVKAASGRVPVVVQVGCDSVVEAKRLAHHAQDIGADAVAAIQPMYFKLDSLEVLISCLAEIAAGAANLPFYFYYLPAITRAKYDMVEFLRQGSLRIPTLAGIKFSSLDVHEYQACLEYQAGRYNILFGCDEMLTSGLSVGAPGAVGSTFNFAAPLYHRIIEAFRKGDYKEAQRCQSMSVEMVRIFCRYRGQPGFKAAMKLIGLDCGPNRLPLNTLSPQESTVLQKDLDAIGFFDWALEPVAKPRIVTIPEKPTKPLRKDLKI
jgi:N-acetylneuraminate lyase